MRRRRCAASRGRAGFTLLELLIATTITGLVLFLVNTIFSEASRSVSRGAQVGEITHKTRTLDEQLRHDTLLSAHGPSPQDWRGRMVGPFGAAQGEPGGVLVVINHRIEEGVTTPDGREGVYVADVDAVTPNPNEPTETGAPTFVRSDQLLFIYDQRAGGPEARLPALAPASDRTYGGDQTNAANSDYARIWYGHVIQIPDDELPASISQSDTRPGGRLALGEGPEGNPNGLASQWVLGRHALLLHGPGASGVAANEAWVQSSVPGLGELWQGFTDVSEWALRDLTRVSDTPAQNGFLGTMGNLGEYHVSVLDTIAFGDQRLLTVARPDPSDPLGGGSGPPNAIQNLEVEAIAPAHTYFMAGVSDFIIDWADDYYALSGGTLNTSTLNPDGIIDRNADGSIRWYSLYPNNPAASGTFDPFQPVTFAPPTNARAVVDPGNLPRYAGTGTPPAPGGGAMVWADADFLQKRASINDVPRWPFLLRVRYRLHDRQGSFIGRRIDHDDDPLTPDVLERGQWFETIIPVNRQQAD